MPSVETQTSWSWLKDLALISELNRSHQGVDFSLSQQEIRGLEEAIGKTGIIEQTEEGTQVHDVYKDNSFLQVETSSPLSSSEGFVPLVDQQVDEPLTEVVSSKMNEDKEMNEGDIKSDSQVHLPQIVSLVDANGSEKDRVKTQQESLQLPPVFDQLQQVQLLSESNKSSPTNSDTEENQVEDIVLEQYANLKLPNLPWPSILQYLRESESYAAKYFSLQNKPALEKRLKGASDSVKETSSTTRTQDSTHRQSLSKGDTAGSSSSEDSDSEANEIDPLKSTKEQELAVSTCEFCGLQNPRYSLLTSTTSSVDDELLFCCDEYKEFCILVATCMRQLVDRLQHGPPQKISVKLTKKKMKKTAEQRAFAMMCRKRKWEQLLQKQIKKAEKFAKFKKQTGTIQFSLLCPSTLDMGWMVRPQSTSKHQTPGQRKAEARRRRTERKQQMERTKKMKVLSPGLLKRLQADMPSFGDLDQRLYSDGTPFLTLLPDRTGQCYYPSGSIAAIIFSPYKGVLAYMLYEDGSQTLLAYLDELGRACCYNSDGHIQLHSTQAGGIIFKGSVQRNWTWESDSSSGGSFQQVTLSLNKQLAVKFHSRGSSTVTFSSGHKIFKFSINCKLHDDESLTSTSDLSWIGTMDDHLQNSKRRASDLLNSLQSNSRLKKLAQMRSVYDPAASRGHLPQTNVKATRRRTRSTGTLPIKTPLHKQPTTLKPVI